MGAHGHPRRGVQRWSAAQEARERGSHVFGRERGRGLQHVAQVDRVLGLELLERAHAALLLDDVEQQPRKHLVLITQRV